MQKIFLSQLALDHQLRLSVFQEMSNLTQNSRSELNRIVLMIIKENCETSLNKEM